MYVSYLDTNFLIVLRFIDYFLPISKHFLSIFYIVALGSFSVPFRFPFGSPVFGFSFIFILIALDFSF